MAISRKRKEMQTFGLRNSNFLVLLCTTEFCYARTEQSIFCKFSKVQVLKISQDSEHSLGDISKTERDTELRIAPY